MPERLELDWGVSELIRDFAQLKDTLGSSGAAAGELSLLGGGLGISDIRGAAEALHRATLSGLGAATASRFGIPIRPLEVGGATDRGAMLIQALEGLRETRRTEGFSQALADARNLGLEDWIGVVHLMDDQFQKIKQEAMATADIYSPERIAAATMLNFEMARLHRSLGDIGVSLGSLVLPVLADVAGWVADILRPGTGRGASRTAGESGLSGSMRELKQSIDQNTNTLRQIPGFYGGGARARAAIPSAFGIGQGQYLQQNLQALRKSIGGFPLP